MDWKKLGLSAGAGVVSAVVVKFVVGALLSTTIVALAAGVTAAYLVYTKVALWEMKKLVDQAKSVVK